MKVLVTGATGLIGRRLVHSLMRQGYQVYALARDPSKLPELPAENTFRWSGYEPPPAEAFKNCVAVIHLAGEGIADSLWTETRKKRLWDSRIHTTQLLIQAIAALAEKERPQVFISGSAIGFYANSDHIQDESSSNGEGFLSHLCAKWEQSALKAEDMGLRTVLLRTGLVLAKEGGILKKSGPVILGDGRQWMSWIHLEDVIGIINFAITDKSVKGPLNLVAPYPVTNAFFTKTLTKLKKIPFQLKAPKFLLKALLGDMSQVVLANQKIKPQKVLSAGYQFKFENLEPALRHLTDHKSANENIFSTKQFVPVARQQVFSFFSKAENLEILTPPWLNFNIVDKSTAQIQKGTLINYKLKIHGFPVRWKTLIQEWNPDSHFVDYQLSGPYKKWHHLHTFEDVHGGTLISDDVTFIVPGGFFGRLLLPFIKKDVQQIFAYRQSKIQFLQNHGEIK